jgi:hypothetical protein
MTISRIFQIAALLGAGAGVYAQQAPIAYVPAAGVTVSGSLSVADGKVSIGNNGTIKAGESTAMVKLARGGDLRVCASTEVHLSRDTSVQGADSALMIAMDRGALESSYVPGIYSDVLLTPDLRILISGPGTADLKIRVNKQGDTCVDNHGANAPYVTVTSQFEGGVYRVQPNQRVMFEHGSLQQVVDNEAESCGCPAAAPVAVASSGAKPQPGKTAAEAANPFPLARSEGLAGPEPEPTEPVVPVGVAHAEVAAPIAYSAAVTPNPEAPGAAGKAPEALSDARVPTKVQTESQTLDAEIAPATSPKPHRGFFGSIGHFFKEIFAG